MDARLLFPRGILSPSKTSDSDGSAAKNLPANVGDPGDKSSISGLGRSPGEGNGNQLQYSCLENPMTEEPGGLQSMRLQSRTLLK